MTARYRLVCLFLGTHLLFASCEQQQTCGAALGIPKVALMFLTRGTMPLAPVWDHWLQPLAGIAPVSQIEEALCRKELSWNGCFMEQGTNALQNQALFSFYAHSSIANVTQYQPQDLFYGAYVQGTSKIVWGDTSAAVLQLMQAALMDPLNQRFVLLSDADIPIYPARVIYAQLMSETLSRIAACQAFDMANINRYTCKMSLEGIHIHHWRKNSLWFALQRQHAEMFITETAIRNAFQNHCSGVVFDKAIGRYRGCLVDEHYYSTVFAKLSRSEETDCKGIVSISDISRSIRGHPKMYSPPEINFDLVSKIRYPIPFLGQAFCANETLWQNAKDQYLAISTAIAHNSPEQCPWNLGVNSLDGNFVGTLHKLFLQRFQAKILSGVCSDQHQEAFGRYLQKVSIMPHHTQVGDLVATFPDD